MGHHRDRTPATGFRGVANPEQAHWMRELRKSNAAQPHETKARKGSRRERERRSIRDQSDGSDGF